MALRSTARAMSPKVMMRWLCPHKCVLFQRREASDTQTPRSPTVQNTQDVFFCAPAIFEPTARNVKLPLAPKEDFSNMFQFLIVQFTKAYAATSSQPGTPPAFPIQARTANRAFLAVTDGQGMRNAVGALSPTFPKPPAVLPQKNEAAPGTKQPPPPLPPFPDPPLAGPPWW